MKAINYLIILSASLCIFNSCTKDVAGPTGPQGKQGAQGPSSSYYVTIDSIAVGSTSWVSSQTTGGASDYIFTIYPVNGLTTASNSIVEVYYSETNNSFSSWYELPAVNTLVAGDGFNFYFYNYNVVIEYLYGSAPTSNIYFKVVVITPP
jgi:hypothetical protein